MDRLFRRKLCSCRCLLLRVCAKPLTANRNEQDGQGQIVQDQGFVAVSYYEETEIKFAAMSHEEIDWYVNTSEPMDKAGAYAIQGLGARFVEEIEGDYFNVVGLPIRLVCQVFVESFTRKENRASQ